jgi:hypothetical protein
MSVLSAIKFLLKRFIKNPILVTAGAYLLWKFLNKYTGKKENFSESLKVIKDDGKKSIIYDTKLNKYILIKK